MKQQTVQPQTPSSRDDHQQHLYLRTAFALHNHFKDNPNIQIQHKFEFNLKEHEFVIDLLITHPHGVILLNVSDKTYHEFSDNLPVIEKLLKSINKKSSHPSSYLYLTSLCLKKQVNETDAPSHLTALRPMLEQDCHTYLASLYEYNPRNPLDLEQAEEKVVNEALSYVTTYIRVAASFAHLRRKPSINGVHQPHPPLATQRPSAAKEKHKGRPTMISHVIAQPNIPQTKQEKTTSTYSPLDHFARALANPSPMTKAERQAREMDLKVQPPLLRFPHWIKH